MAILLDWNLLHVDWDIHRVYFQQLFGPRKFPYFSFSKYKRQESDEKPEKDIYGN